LLTVDLQVTFSGFWNFDTDNETKRTIYEMLTSKMDAVRNVTMGSGAYQVRIRHTSSATGPYRRTMSDSW
jgi:hypothetical protein